MSECEWESIRGSLAWHRPRWLPIYMQHLHYTHSYAESNAQYSYQNALAKTRLGCTVTQKNTCIVLHCRRLIPTQEVKVWQKVSVSNLICCNDLSAISITGIKSRTSKKNGERGNIWHERHVQRSLLRFRIFVAMPCALPFASYVSEAKTWGGNSQNKSYQSSKEYVVLREKICYI